MPELKSADGRYLAADQGRNSFVLYDLHTGAVLWDRWAHEGGRHNAFPEGAQPLPPPAPPPESPPLAPGQPPLGGGGGIPIRVTDERDGDLINRGYSYHSQAWVNEQTAYVFVGHADGTPRFFVVDLTSGHVRRWNDNAMTFTGTSEGWYWDAHGRIYLCDGPRLRRVSPFTGEGEDVIILDISERYPGHDLWQAHSADDGQTHSATVRRITSDGPYEKIGTIVQRHGRELYFRAEQPLDESQVSRCGHYLVIKEGDDNKIVTLDTGEIRTISDSAGALGHSDAGHGVVLGEDNQQGACVLIDLVTLASRPLFSTWSMGYVSYRGGRLLHSGDTHLRLIDPQTGAATELYAHGGGADYDSRVKAALSPCGRVASWVSPAAGRNDLYVMVL